MLHWDIRTLVPYDEVDGIQHTPLNRLVSDARRAFGVLIRAEF